MITPKQKRYDNGNGDMAKGRKDVHRITGFLMRKYLSHDHTPNIDRQLKEQFDSYFAWHEDYWERGKIDSFGGPTGTQLNRYILAGKLALSAPRLLPGPPNWMRPGRLASLIIYLKEIAYDRNLDPPSALNPFY